MSRPDSVEGRLQRLRRSLAYRCLWLILLCGLGLFLSGQRAALGIVMPESGSILGWGSNAEGSFGDGQSKGRAVPASIQRMSVGLSGKTVKLVAAGATHSVAVTDDNLIFTWGLNTEGQLGTNDLEPRLLPTAVNDLNGVLTGKVIVEVAVARGFTMVRTQDDLLFGWGMNIYGQLGTGSTSLRSLVPVATLMGGMAGKTLKRIVCSGWHTLALTAEGNVFAWGYNGYGETGAAGYSGANPTPLLVAGVGTASARPVQDISGGFYHSVALLQDGTVYGWGLNSSGQLAVGPNQYSYTNVPQAALTSGVLAGKTVNAIASGDYHVLVLASDGRLYAWGSNGSNELGNGGTTTALSPVAVTMTAFGGKTISKIYSGGGHNYAVASDNSVFGWGLNTNGQLGNNSLVNLSAPTPITFAGGLAGKTVLPTSYSLGVAHTLAFDDTGKVIAWGQNIDGRLGISSLERYIIPVAVAGRELNIKTFSQVVAGADFAAALASDGSVFAWGANGDGQLGNNSLGTSASLGWAVAGGSLNTASVSLAGGSVTSGSLRATVTSTTGLVAGMSLSGSSGIPAGATVVTVTDGTSFTMSAPAISSTSGTFTAGGQFSQLPVTSLAAGQRHVVAIAGGKAYGWGDNLTGQLGDSSQTDRAMPVSTMGTGVRSGKTLTGVAPPPARPRPLP
jgi:alpha-tubulin suppressor-like RCC1 family protein